MSDIYDQHRAAFANVSAYVVTKGADHERVATIAFKFPRDGAGRLYVYVHWIGLQMVRGSANGYGYDKRTAACASAAKALDKIASNEREARYVPDACADFVAALAEDSGHEWSNQLLSRGFSIIQAV